VNDDVSILQQLYGSRKFPYYIYAPRWITSSAGIKALHYFCHSLNEKGFPAYLILTEAIHAGEPRVNPNLRTPILTNEIADAHYRAGLTPIVVYSETIPGNPLNATAVVRYLMNYAGALGGEKLFDDNEMIIAFSKKISMHYAKKNKTKIPPVLFLPPVDPREIQRNDHKENFQIIYAGKYRSFIGKPPKVGRLDSFEIFRDGPRMQSRKQVLDLIGRASVLYSFENSSIVTEAILSGTPVYFVPNKFLGEIIAEDELGSGGVAKTDTEVDIDKARRSISSAIARYYKSIERFNVALDDFIANSQLLASSEGCVNQIHVPDLHYLVNAHRMSLAKQILKHQGLKTLFRVTYRFVMRRLSWRYWVDREK
jgi:hypothetical protein